VDLKQKYGNTALIAGGSEGIGAAFATYLAKEGFDLVLIARRPKLLQQLADTLENRYKADITCLTCDLTDPDATKEILESLESREINLLVYNAASSIIGPFINNTPEQHIRIAQSNMITPLNMVHVLGKKMLAEGRGAIILMASLAGFQGSGFLSVYAATKAFTRILAESLWYEWKNSGVDVIACCAGATATPNFKNTEPEKSGFFAPRILDPDEVVSECFRKLGKRPSYITGRGNRVASFIMQNILPRKKAVNIMGNNTKNMYRL
jgi:short-subunit dehydrogenase